MLSGRFAKAVAATACPGKLNDTASETAVIAKSAFESRGTAVSRAIMSTLSNRAAQEQDRTGLGPEFAMPRTDFRIIRR
jgi:hypothetical protein